MKKIMTVIGTRPEAIKLCPLITELKKREKWDVFVCATGQHREMSDEIFRLFNVKPDVDLRVMGHGQSLPITASKILNGIDDILMQEKPNMLVVQGDTVTAYAAALAGFYYRIPVSHIEAGLRTYCMHAPFPEEMHRATLSLLADYHFAPTASARQNLLREGKNKKTIFVTGNTVIDALRFTLTEKEPKRKFRFSKQNRIVLFTAHRRENVGAPLNEMLSALLRLVKAFPDLMVICPMHPNPRVREAIAQKLSGVPRIFLTKPLDLVTFHHLLSKTSLILTDSGGVQEEATALGIPTLVMRHSTEREEGIKSGVLRLAGCDEGGIFSLAQRLLTPGNEEYKRMRKPSGIFGDGYAARRIVDQLELIL